MTVGYFVAFCAGSWLMQVVVSSNICIERKPNSCGECIALPGCAWCQDPNFANNPNVIIPRCNLPETLMADGCAKSSISNPKSKQRPTSDRDFSDTGEVTVGSATQIKPQAIAVKLRPGDPVTIDFAFKLVEDYPVDLYYLLDLSKSMKDDLDSLRTLGKDLGESMQKITKDLRMGFGSFVDKTVMPYISTVPERVENPCSKSTCGPAYSFHNDLPLSENIDAFVDSVKKVNISSNIDHPEGGMDAMMQAIVCQKAIGWRENASHLLVFSTDANFHIAGDGRLGGIVEPNDGLCYLDMLGRYTRGNEMDYPSVGHLVQKINENKIQPIFAVTSNVVTNYNNLQDIIPKSVVGELTASSTNIINIIEEAYNSLKGKIIIDVKTPKGVAVSDTRGICGDVESTELQCDGVKLRDTVNFQFSLSTEQCLTKSAIVQVSVFGYNDVLNITVSPQCKCRCEESETPNNCSNHGKFECGSCVCDPGFTGLDCSCDQKNVEGFEEYIKNCTDPSTQLVCSDRGTCQCGKCICDQRPEQKIDGNYCQCDSTSCDRVEGKICNNAGKCNCGVCECDPGWRGSSCECNTDSSLCMDRSASATNPTQICNGNGICVCGQCECGEAPGGGMYRGSFCNTSPIVVCQQHKECFQCLAYKTGVYSDPNTCRSNCQNYNVTKTKSTGKYKQECRFTDESDDCIFVAYFEEINDVIMAEVDPDKVCKAYINPMYVIIGIIAAIVLIGLVILLLWKLFTSIKDAREFKNFQKESQNAKWQAGENPIYKKATSTFKNPMYTGGKPTSNL